MFPSKSKNAVQVARLATEVNRNDGFGLGSERCRQVVGSHIQGIGLAVDKNGFRAEIKHHLRGCRESHRRHDDLVFRSDANRLERQMKRRGTRIDSHGMAATDEVSESALEFSNLFAGG